MLGWYLNMHERYEHATSVLFLLSIRLFFFSLIYACTCYRFWLQFHPRRRRSFGFLHFWHFSTRIFGFNCVARNVLSNQENCCIDLLIANQLLLDRNDQSAFWVNEHFIYFINWNIDLLKWSELIWKLPREKNNTINNKNKNINWLKCALILTIVVVGRRID